MSDIAEEHYAKHPWITRKHLWKKFGMEVGDDAREHRPTASEGCVAEEHPGKTYEMEGQYRGSYASPTC